MTGPDPELFYVVRLSPRSAGGFSSRTWGVASTLKEACEAIECNAGDMIEYLDGYLVVVKGHYGTWGLGEYAAYYSDRVGPWYRIVDEDTVEPCGTPHEWAKKVCPEQPLLIEVY